MYSLCKVIRPDRTETEALVFGPLSVKPELHKKGIGSTLVRTSLEKAKELGFKAVLITGHPEYYPRFGFVPARNFNITMPDGATFDAFMALEIVPGSLGTKGGTWHCCKAFETIEHDKEAFSRFEESFRKGK